MRRLSVVMAIAVAATLALSAAAPAKTQKYEGQVFDTLATVDFKLERDDGKLYVMHFHVDELPVTCVSGTSRTVNIGIRRMRVKRGKFGETTYFGDFRGSAHAVVHGKLRRGGQARGDVFYTNGFDGVALCESGEMGWSAER